MFRALTSLGWSLVMRPPRVPRHDVGRRRHTVELAFVEPRQVAVGQTKARTVEDIGRRLAALETRMEDITDLVDQVVRAVDATLTAPHPSVPPTRPGVPPGSR